MNDFAILSSVKSPFRMYEQIFTQSGLKLNKKIADNLRETDSIILIESLLRMYAHYNGYTNEDRRHLFASIARSYAFEYSDSKLYGLLHYEKGEDPYLKLKLDPLWNQIERFSKKYALSSFSDVFLALIDEFHVIDRLPKIGEVANGVAKIESLYQMVLNNEAIGNGVKEFLEMLSEMDKHSLEYKSETLTQCEDAVDMMTIHASKGLERKIVYLPVSLNSLNKGDNRLKSIFNFSLEKGIAFPYLEFEPTEQNTPDNPFKTSIETVLTSKKISHDNDPYIDDHVRLFYVALTRAENQIIVVGDDNKTKENLYSMFDSCPHFIKANEAYFSSKIKEGVLKQKDYDAFCMYGEMSKTVSLPSIVLPSSSSLRAYKKIGEEFYLKAPLALQNEYLSLFCSQLYEHYCEKIKAIKDLDELTRLYVALFLPSIPEEANVNSFSSYSRYLDKKRNPDDDIEIEYESEAGEEEESDESGEEALSASSESKILDKEQRIRDSIAHFLANDCQYFSINLPKKATEKDNKEAMEKIFVPALAKYFDGANYLTYVSYENEGYEDKVVFADDKLSFGQIKPAKPPYFVEPRIDEREFVLAVEEHKRASKKIVLTDEDRPSSFILEKGIKLHRHLEMIDIAEGDVSFISDYDERRIIKRVLDLPIMRLAKESIVHSEYQFNDPIAHSTGSIDLFFIHDDEYYIVDYKTSRINDPAYKDQLLVYRDNVSRIFRVEKEKIHLYLISIVKGEQKEVFP